MTIPVRLWRAPPIVHPVTPVRRPAAQRSTEARSGMHTEPGAGESSAWIPLDTYSDAVCEDAPEHEPPTHDHADAQPDDAAPEAPPLHTSAMASRLVRTCSEISVGSTVTEHLAQLLSKFCGSRVVKANSECWEVTLDLDPRVLPDTRLTLRLSPHTLWLRFLAAHPRARDLLSEHGDALRQRIHVLLEQRIDIELEVW
ncbi:type III secretion system protein SctP [Ralstonia edaphi]|nr:type III secretion system protein SctP [Ralstonia sp. LMG 6871]